MFGNYERIMKWGRDSISKLHKRNSGNYFLVYVELGEGELDEVLS